MLNITIHPSIPGERHGSWTEYRRHLKGLPIRREYMKGPLPSYFRFFFTHTDVSGFLLKRVLTCPMVSVLCGAEPQRLKGMGHALYVEKISESGGQKHRLAHSMVSPTAIDTITAATLNSTGTSSSFSEVMLVFSVR